ncbi:retropepsin-like aspartic protease family protein [Pseudoroseicyclus aestuarii]|uniref:Aspartyl protease family protein n=1 Tax=Pseudoroseicyclus aestuarii TaxID=1795041 RepID=A0A318SNB1_9RHOB|nr:TIGR02281 family clan AA aspartic protease [Pseudoroseicyclus aestuarii]PYE82303.1 aspartyl protease family protein [Pseudoroseicyclus aestuarii]
MTGDEIARILFLVLLGTALVGWFITENRASLGKTARMAAAWGMIFLGVIAAVGLWGDIRGTVLPRQSLIGGAAIEVPQARDGHYYLTLQINGTPVEFVVDTGATDMVLSEDDARRAGIDPGALTYGGQAMTANGAVRTAAVWLDSVSLEGITDTDVRAVVTDGGLPFSLLGMGYLRLFGRIEIEDGRLVLTR